VVVVGGSQSSPQSNDESALHRHVSTNIDESDIHLNPKEGEELTKTTPEGDQQPAATAAADAAAAATTEVTESSAITDPLNEITSSRRRKDVEMNSGLFGVNTALIVPIFCVPSLFFICYVLVLSLRRMRNSSSAQSFTDSFRHVIVDVIKFPSANGEAGTAATEHNSHQQQQLQHHTKQQQHGAIDHNALVVNGDGTVTKGGVMQIKKSSGGMALVGTKKSCPPLSCSAVDV
jgi:uncharacterized membrane protein